MKIDVKVIPRAKTNRMIQETSPVRVYVTAPALDGWANKALIEYFAQYYRVAKTRVTIARGLKSRYKTIIIEGL